MRPIEFRAWDKKAKVMVYPVVVYETQDHVGFSAQTFRRCYDQDEWYEHLEVGDDWYYLFDNRGVMQYTGLQDANGQKIFEGDVVRGKWKETLKPMVVLYQPPSFIMKTNPRNKTWSTFDIYPDDNQIYIVIGNIHQNKELLNEVKK